MPENSRTTSTLVVAVVAASGAIFWSLSGFVIAATSGDFFLFLKVWFLSQAGPGLFAAIFLALLAKSKKLNGLLRTLDPSLHHKPLLPHFAVSLPVILFIAIVGTLTTTRLGWPLDQPTLMFSWVTCGIICTLAGFATVHAFEILVAARMLEGMKVNLFMVSPGETTSLRRLAIYFATIGGAMTVGYIFAFIGTISVDWRGSPRFVQAVQSLWPMIYVPTCLVVTTYPPLVIRKLIRAEKERIISRYQQDINSILEGPGLPTKEAIDKVNSLADLIQRVERSPDFALSLPVTITTLGAYVIQLGSFVIPKDSVGSYLRQALLSGFQ